ncbi:hypothetical protein KEJ15_05435 [Candidatus Bathyarchaeota archaeon]|nr:hypothetical protein [Candidatus Bathyarchaeota archaeon]
MIDTKEEHEITKMTLVYSEAQKAHAARASVSICTGIGNSFNSPTQTKTAVILDD